MVGTGATMMAFRLVRSKLRKRDHNDNTTDVCPQDLVMQTSQTAVSTICGTTTTQAGDHLTNGTALQNSPQFLWQYPARYPTYSNDQDSLVRTLPGDRPGFCRGFRKNLRGRWRRLVKSKPQPEAYTIPVELRDQLKQIYVY
uniref:Uncharacterized protein n=5 Tax=Timema TaxID=61471 RepID=A0A7R9P006_9NEOP|nr:unnamed protein product [Timema douglasi]CAD7444366.1 unnamed protein product [Timema bartmani]CAD7462644.1 unnamed protein product [Timema tahoe]CAD7575855.1 unnamed protein product [Timema californicum]CAD7608779.1 unnamed protein product [Timema genevievae]